MVDDVTQISDAIYTSEQPTETKFPSMCDSSENMTIICGMQRMRTKNKHKNLTMDKKGESSRDKSSKVKNKIASECSFHSIKLAQRQTSNL